MEIERGKGLRADGVGSIRGVDDEIMGGSKSEGNFVV